jgi:hypothetical protein
MNRFESRVAEGPAALRICKTCCDDLALLGDECETCTWARERREIARRLQRAELWARIPRVSPVVALPTPDQQQQNARAVRSIVLMCVLGAAVLVAGLLLGVR